MREGCKSTESPWPYQSVYFKDGEKLIDIARRNASSFYEPRCDLESATKFQAKLIWEFVAEWLDSQNSQGGVPESPPELPQENRRFSDYIVKD